MLRDRHRNYSANHNLELRGNWNIKISLTLLEKRRLNCFAETGNHFL
jgi:hypothetical protein